MKRIMLVLSAVALVAACEKKQGDDHTTVDTTKTVVTVPVKDTTTIVTKTTTDTVDASDTGVSRGNHITPKLAKKHK